MNETKATSEPVLLAQGRFLRLVRQGQWEYAERIRASGAAVIVAVTEDHRLLLVEQYRVPVGCRTIELPAGVCGDEPETADEAWETAARRELREETGYDATRLERLLTGPSGPGMISEIVTFFRATGLRRVGQGGGVAGEGITVHEVPLDGLEAWLNERSGGGTMIDPKVYAGLYWIRIPRAGRDPGR